jgi:HAD superfamily hydrolase (TIGR01509 family)
MLLQKDKGSQLGTAGLHQSRVGNTLTMSSLRPGVLFDVDGTLVDTNYLHTLAWSRALRSAGEWAPMNAIHRLVGMGGDQLVVRLLGHDSPAAEKARPARYRELRSDARAFPSSRELLIELAQTGVAVVLATSSPPDELGASLALMGAPEAAIAAMTTAGDVSRTKPAPDIFEAALNAGSVDRGRAVVVGDSVWDIEAATAARLPCVGVESGGFSEHELADAGAIAVYRDVADLLGHLGDSPLVGVTRI